MTEQEKKVLELTRLLCKWNRKELKGDAFASQVWVLFEKEALETWNDPLEKLFV